MNTTDIIAVLALLVSALLLVRVIALQVKVKELRDDLDRLSGKPLFPNGSAHNVVPSPVAAASHTEMQTLVEERVLFLLNQGKKIQAIKEVREKLNLSLKEGKDFVEAIEHQNT